MLGDVAKSLDLLLKLRADKRIKKRELLGKELLKVYLDLGEVITCGREILFLLEPSRIAHIGCGIPIALLSRQYGALVSLQKRLTTGVLDSVLKLHSPVLAQKLCGVVDFKAGRVWFTLDQLVSDGVELSPEEWVTKLEQRMEDLEGGIKRTLSENIYCRNVRHFDPILIPSVYDTVIIGTVEESKKGHEVLDELTRAREMLREFIVQTFTLEELL